jgi:hypothetical protein
LPLRTSDPPRRRKGAAWKEPTDDDGVSRRLRTVLCLQRIAGEREVYFLSVVERSSRLPASGLRPECVAHASEFGTAPQMMRSIGRGESLGAYRATDEPLLWQSSWCEPAGASCVGNISKGNKAHGRTGGSGTSDGARALRTRRRSNASKVHAHPPRFGVVAAAHALKDRPGNGLGRRRRWLRVRPEALRRD